MSEQRRRIKTEDQTIWIIGWIAHQDDLNEKDEFILIFKIVLSLGIGWFAHQDDLKEKDECILFLKIVLGKIASATRNWINSPPPPPQTDATTFAFSSVFILLVWWVGCLQHAGALLWAGHGPRWEVLLLLALHQQGAGQVQAGWWWGGGGGGGREAGGRGLHTQPARPRHTQHAVQPLGRPRATRWEPFCRSINVADPDPRNPYNFATDSDSDLILAHLDNVKTKNKIANLKGYSHEILNGCKWF